MTKKLLLISNSTNPGEEYLGWPREYMKDFIRSHDITTVVFIPWAGVNLVPEGIETSFDAYEKRVAGVFASLGAGLRSVHRVSDPVKTVREAPAIVVGGGNTFHLVKMMHETGIMQAIRDRVLEGIPFMGWSAGANVACPTMKTTNDMPISEPPSFECLGLVPFQINPHYLDAHLAGHGGETREQRIREFLAVNREVPVLGIRESSLLWVEGETMNLLGNRGAKLFRFGEEPVEYDPGADLSFLLK